MPRVARIVAPGLPHHIIQRGNNRQDVFFTDDDRRLYLEILRERCLECGVTIQAWCLMTNHVHLVATPPEAPSLHRAIGRTHWRYAQIINRLHRRSGHLWQNRFHSCILDGEYECAAIRYVERNPVRARMVRLPWRYAWSSAAAHCGMDEDRLGLLDLRSFRRRYPGNQWKAILSNALPEEQERHLERCLRSGRPLASDRLLAKLEAALGRRLRPMPRGRPRKHKMTISKTRRRAASK